MLLLAISSIDFYNPYSVSDVEKLRTTVPGITAASVISNSGQVWERVSTNRVHLKSEDRRTERFWFKTQVTNKTDIAQDFVFEFDVPFTPGLQVYIIRDQDPRSLQPLTADVSSTKPNRVFRLDAGQSCDVMYTLDAEWLYNLVPFSLYPKADFVILQRIRFFLIAAYLGGLLCILSYNLYIFFFVKESAYFYYVLYHAAAIVFVLPYDGFIRFTRFKESDAIHADLMSFSFLGMHVFATLFINRFLNNREDCPLADRIAKVLLWMMCGAGILAVFLPTSYRFVLVIAACVLVEIVFLCVVFVAMRLADRAMFFVAWTLVVSGSFITVLSFVGGIHPTLITRNLENVGVLLEAILLSYALAQRLKQTEREKYIIRQALANQVDRLKLNEIFGKVYSSRFGTIRREATIMFACVADFAEFCRHHEPEVSSASLKILTDAAYQLVPGYFGLIDRFVGDGILAVFGLDGQVENHCDAAFNFGKALQLAVFQQCEQRGLTQIPIRIGIHVDQIMIGDLGKSVRTDFSIVGHGVNFAKRIESSAGLGAVRMSQEVFERLSVERNDHGAIYPSFFMAKNIRRSLLAYEYLPFSRDFLSDKLLQKYLNPINLEIKSSFGSFRIVDYFDDCLILVGPTSLSQGIYIDARMIFGSQQRLADLARYQLHEIQLVVVKSERIQRDLFALTAKINGGNHRQKQIIGRTIKQWLLHDPTAKQIA